MGKQRVTSGMRPTGSIHLGNLLGALDNWVRLQERYDCFYFIVDWHALTTPGGEGAVGFEHVADLRRNVHEMAVDWIAAGLDPERCAIFVQSHVPEVAELHLLFSMITPLGWLERNPTYRDMLQGYRIENPSYGLLGYPTLQSADILAYKGDLVPVGKDQEAHVNMTRDLAQRFNSLYEKKIFPITQPLLTETPRIPGLDGIERKMSKSAGNYIALTHDEDETTRRIKSMFTDPVKIRKDDPGHPDGCVVYAFHGIYDRAHQGQVRVECETGSRGCVDCKMQLASLMNGALRAIRARRLELEAEPGRVREILGAGAERARVVAAETMREVREAMNIPTRENV